MSAQTEGAGQSTPADLGTQQASLSFEDAIQKPISDYLSQLPPASPPLVVHYSDSVISVLTALQNRGARSAVVLRASRSWFPRCGGQFRKSKTKKAGLMKYQKRKCYSFFDVRDLCYHVMRLYQMWPSKTVQEVISMAKREKVGAVANVSSRVPFVYHSSSESLASIGAAFSPCCRVPVFDADGKLSVLSPADLLGMLRRWDLVREIERRENVSIKALARRDVITITEFETLLKAMTLMERHGYSAIPIVASRNSNEILEVITVKDIRYLCTAQDKLGSKDILNAPALSFVNFIRSGRKALTTSEERREWIVMLDDEATLEEICKVFINRQTHRILLKSADGTLTGLVTLTDVMRRLAVVLSRFQIH